MNSDHITNPNFLNREKLLATFVKFLQKIRLKNAINKTIHDPRCGHCEYPLSTIILSAFETVLFRLTSKNAFKTLSHSPTACSEALAVIFQNDVYTIPDTKTIDDVLSRISPEEMNELNFALFETLVRSKFFLNHSSFIPNLTFYLAIDGEAVHTYRPESSHNPESCPYCLKREHKSGKANFHHIDVVASIVCPGKIKLPIYSYRVHAVSPEEKLELKKLSDQKFKQECEEKTLPHILEAIRKRFPRLSFHVLLDALYANGPVIKTVSGCKMGYTIVFKQKQLSTIREECQCLEKTPKFVKKHHAAKKQNQFGREILQQCKWYDSVDYKGLKINVIYFDEKEKNNTHWDWLTSQALTIHNIFNVIKGGRLRWQEEDLFNTFETRGFDIHHDYSRNPDTQVIWAKLIHIAFFITELFVNSDVILNRFRGNVPIKHFMRTLFDQFLDSIRDRISECITAMGKIQFRYSTWSHPP